MHPIHLRHPEARYQTDTWCGSGHPFPMVAASLAHAEKAETDEKPLCPNCRDLATAKGKQYNFLQPQPAGAPLL